MNDSMVSGTPEVAGISSFMVVARRDASRRAVAYAIRVVDPPAADKPGDGSGGGWM